MYFKFLVSDHLNNKLTNKLHLTIKSSQNVLKQFSIHNHGLISQSLFKQNMAKPFYFLSMYFLIKAFHIV